MIDVAATTILPLVLSVFGAVPLPAVSVAHRDAAGCGLVQIAGRAAVGGPRGACLREAFALRLEPGRVNVAVVLSPRRDAPRRVFLYRLAGRRLVPRFLGSGFLQREILAARSLPGAPLDRLGLTVRSVAEGPEPTEGPKPTIAEGPEPTIAGGPEPGGHGIVRRPPGRRRSPINADQIPAMELACTFDAFPLVCTEQTDPVPPPSVERSASGPLPSVDRTGSGPLPPVDRTGSRLPSVE